LPVILEGTRGKDKRNALKGVSDALLRKLPGDNWQGPALCPHVQTGAKGQGGPAMGKVKALGKVPPCWEGEPKAGPPDRILLKSGAKTYAKTGPTKILRTSTPEKP